MCLLVDAHFPRKEYKSVVRVLKDILILTPHRWMIQTRTPHYPLSPSQLRNIIHSLSEPPFIQVGNDEMEMLLEIAIKLQLDSFLRDKLTYLGQVYLDCGDFVGLVGLFDKFPRDGWLNLIEGKKSNRHKVFLDRFFDFVAHTAQKYAHSSLYAKLSCLQGDTCQDRLIVNSLFYKEDILSDAVPTREFLQERRQLFYDMMKTASKQLFFAANLLDPDVLLLQLLSGQGENCVQFEADPNHSRQFHGGQLIRYVDLDLFFYPLKDVSVPYSKSLQKRVFGDKNIKTLFRYMHDAFLYVPRTVLFKKVMDCGRTEVAKCLWDGVECVRDYMKEVIEKNPHMKPQKKSKAIIEVEKEHFDTWLVVIRAVAEQGNADVFKYILSKCPAEHHRLKREIPRLTRLAVSKGNIEIFDILYAKFFYLFGPTKPIKLSLLHTQAETSYCPGMIHYLSRLFEAKSVQGDMDLVVAALKSGADINTLINLIEPYQHDLQQEITLNTEANIPVGEWLLSVAVSGGVLEVVQYLHEQLGIPFNYQAIRHLEKCSDQMIRYVVTRANPFKIVSEEKRGFSIQDEAYSWFQKFQKHSCCNVLRYAHIARYYCGKTHPLAVEKIVFDSMAWVNEEFLKIALNYAVSVDSMHVFEWVVAEKTRSKSSASANDVQTELFICLLRYAPSTKLISRFRELFPSFRKPLDECLHYVLENDDQFLVHSTRPSMILQYLETKAKDLVCIE